MKKIIILSLLAIAILAGGFLFVKRSNPAIPTPSPSPRQEENLQTFTDEEHGISFQYPQQFLVNAGIDFKGRYAIHLFSKDRMNAVNPMERNLDLVNFIFSQEKIENIIKDYREDNTLTNLVINDISIGNLRGKKVSFIAPIGDDIAGILLSWKGDMLLEIFYPPNFQNNIFEKIIASVKQIN